MLQFRRVIFSEEREQHVWQAHQIRRSDVMCIFRGGERTLFLRSRETEPDRAGQMFKGLGRAEDGRYITVIFRRFEDQSVFVVTARDMDGVERKRYMRS